MEVNGSCEPAAALERIQVMVEAVRCSGLSRASKTHRRRESISFVVFISWSEFFRVFFIGISFRRGFFRQSNIFL